MPDVVNTMPEATLHAVADHGLGAQHARPRGVRTRRSV